MINHNVFPKIAVINDLAGFGRCALSVQMPIISHMGIQCCPVPTAIFSNHSAFESFFYTDYTDNILPYISSWEKLKLRFDGILTGFYSSDEQIELVCSFIEKFADKDTKLIVDPIMGDNGTTYSTYSSSRCEKMKDLVKYGDYVLPNLTELCILAGYPYRADYNYQDISDMCETICRDSKKSNKTIIVTGICKGQYINNYIYSLVDGRISKQIVKKKLAGSTRCGTGDVFSSIIAADAVAGVMPYASVKKAADFIVECIKESDRIGMPKTDGVCFERLIKRL